MSKFEYPKGPDSVPENLTKPTSAYKQRAWLAMLGLSTFLLMYFALAGWFVWTAYRFVMSMMGGRFDLYAMIAAGCSAFLAVFMFKALAFVQRGGASNDIEVTADQYPKLFGFLHRLADEAGAPRPHRVFLSNTVNACVFYDLSILNLIFPSRKNLEVGLPLVNVLTAAEFKAVLAHEFGHFAQRTMAIGTWVYIAQQIAGQVISRRDALDTFLRQLSRIDPRIGWIGWVLSLIIWSIRSLLDTVFRFVVIAQRALSRQMEFQADLVAVSLTGSDALVHALHKLRAADDAWDRTLTFANSRLANDKSVEDMFTVQSKIMARMAQILDDPEYGCVPACETDPEKHRIFKTELASAPRMWSTHPDNVDRENNAKQRYVAAPLDERGAWEIFDNVDALRKSASADIFKNIEATPEPIDETLDALTIFYSRANMDGRYRGAYWGRSVVRCASSVKELFNPPVAASLVMEELANLYPDSLATDLQQLRELEKERNQLEALRDGFLEAPGKIIRFRDRQLKKSQLPAVIAEVAEELEEARAKVWEHDRRCRTVHLAAAGSVGKGWAQYLVGLTKALHYADHMEANLRDAQGLMHNVLAIVMADGKVTSSELKRLLKSANVLHDVMLEPYKHAEHIQLDDVLLSELGVSSWAEAMGEFDLPPATDDNANDWMRVIDGWVDSVARPLASLRAEALDVLLKTEGNISSWIKTSTPIENAPKPSLLPAGYATMVPGNERERQKKLGMWDRFQTADGFFPATARVLVAGAIVGAVLGFGASVGVSHVTVYNGLDAVVDVQIGDKTLSVNPFDSDEISFAASDNVQVQAWNKGVLIESFLPDVDVYPNDYVYNVAAASPLLEWSAVYGDVREIPEDYLGAQRWLATDVDILFEEPPESIETKGKGGSRRVLSGFGNEPPSNIANLFSNEDEFYQAIRQHARWDNSRSANFLFWYTAAQNASDDGADILATRLANDPSDVMLQRLYYSTLSGSEKDVWCADQKRAAKSAPSNADMQYLAIRCEKESVQKNIAYMNAAKATPDNPWLAMAAGYVSLGEMNLSTGAEYLDFARTRIPAVGQYVNVELARLRRLQKNDANASVQDLIPGSRELGYLHASEIQDESTSVETLAQQAVVIGERISEYPEDEFYRAKIIWMQAASVGASTEQITQAFALSADEGLDRDTVLLAYALARRTQRDAGAYRDSIAMFYNEEQVDKMIDFLDAVAAGESPRSAEDYLRGIDLGARGHAYAAARLLRADETTNVWQHAAKLILFVAERPNLG